MATAAVCSTHASDEEEDDSDSDDDAERNAWTQRLCEDFHADYLAYLPKPPAGLFSIRPDFKLSCCNCSSSAVKPASVRETLAGLPTPVECRVLPLSALGVELVNVPMFRCHAAEDVCRPTCRKLQHVHLLRLGYFPSTLKEALNLGSQRGNRPRVYFHVGLLEDFWTLQNCAPTLAAKSWCEAYCGRHSHFEVLAVPRLERLLGATLERFRHLSAAI